MDRSGVRKVPEGSGEQRKMEQTGCKIICGAQTTPSGKKVKVKVVKMKKKKKKKKTPVSTRVRHQSCVIVWNIVFFGLARAPIYYRISHDHPAQPVVSQRVESRPSGAL